jgi:hypothetical protein
MRNVKKLIVNLKRNKPLRRPRYIWKANTKRDGKLKGYEDMGWSQLGKDKSDGGFF